MFFIFLTLLNLAWADHDAAISCPEGTTLKSENNGMLQQCCANGKSNDKCYSNGPRVEFKSSKNKARFETSSFKDNLLDGDFTQWWLNTDAVRAKGNFALGRPDGTWELFNKDKKIKVKAVYTSGNLESITEGDIGHKVLKNSAPTLRDSNKKYIGVVSPINYKVGSFYGPNKNSDGRFNHLFLYADSKKKELIGAIIGEFYFTPTSLVIGGHTKGPMFWQESSLWTVYSKIGNMCQVALIGPKENPDYERLYWIDCNNFEDIVDYYRGGYVGAYTDDTFYSSPNGKIIKFNLKEGSSVGSTAGIKITDSKVVNGELWIQIEFKDSCGTSEGYDDYKEDVWIKFWNKDKVNLSRAEIC